MSTFLSIVGWVLLVYFLGVVFLVVKRSWRALAELFFFTWGAPIKNRLFRRQFKTHIKQLSAAQAINRASWNKLQPQEMAYAILSETTSVEAFRLNSEELLKASMKYCLHAGVRLALHEDVPKIK